MPIFTIIGFKKGKIAFEGGGSYLKLMEQPKSVENKRNMETYPNNGRDTDPFIHTPSVPPRPRPAQEVFEGATSSMKLETGLRSKPTTYIKDSAVDASTEDPPFANPKDDAHEVNETTKTGCSVTEEPKELKCSTINLSEKGNHGQLERFRN